MRGTTRSSKPLQQPQVLAGKMAARIERLELENKTLRAEKEKLAESLHKLERYTAMNAMDELIEDGWRKTDHFSAMLDKCRKLLANLSEGKQ